MAAQEGSTGGCLCGTIQYRIAGTPQRTIVCHCDNCQRVTGSAFMVNAWFKEKEVTITQGQNQLVTYADSRTDSQDTLNRSFCGLCGSHMFLRNQYLEELGTIAIATGTINEKENLLPDLELFCLNRRSWVSEIAGTEQVETQ